MRRPIAHSTWGWEWGLRLRAGCSPTQHATKNQSQANGPQSLSGPRCWTGNFSWRPPTPKRPIPLRKALFKGFPKRCTDHAPTAAACRSTRLSGVAGSSCAHWVLPVDNPNIIMTRPAAACRCCQQCCQHGVGPRSENTVKVPKIAYSPPRIEISQVRTVSDHPYP